MGKKPQAGGATRKVRKRAIEDKEQSKQFIQTARDLGASDKSLEAFEAAMSAIAKNAQTKHKR